MFRVFLFNYGDCFGNRLNSLPEWSIMEENGI